MKIVINTCFGGYELSEKAYEYLGLPWDGNGNEFEDDRTNPKLIECVEKLGEEANGELAELHIIEIPDDVKWEINDYDGYETVEEVHRSWGWEGDDDEEYDDE